MEIVLSQGICYTRARLFICILAVTFTILKFVLVDCRRTETLEQKNSVIKTIQTGDGDDVIDCVDIYKQPALSHPLLQNHTIQLIPPPYPNGRNETGSSEDEEPLQCWLLNGECPEGTIPILRTQAFKGSVPKATPIPHSNGSTFEFTAKDNYEYAQVSLIGGQYWGAHTTVNVWSPKSAYPGENSISQIWITGGLDNARSTVEAGWKITDPDTLTRFFTFWTGTNYQRDGCYNHDCPGFVQVSRKVALGAPLRPVSSYNGKQFELFISIYKHQSAGQWWLMVKNEPIGYWPDQILPTLRGSADVVSWGGEIYNRGVGGRHTPTQMGSGHFPGEGYRRASYFRNIQYLASSGKFVDPQGLQPYTTKPSCYDVLIVKNKLTTYGTQFYYGGPGYSARCPR